MKKLVFVALLSLVGVGLSAKQASAWLFCHHCCRSCATICVKPYNAFSPSIFGSVCADGCFPLTCNNHGPCAPPPPWYGAPCCPTPPMYGGSMCCGPMMGCPDGGCLSGPSHGAGMTTPPSGTPAMLPPGTGGPTYQGPQPAPLPNGPAGPTTGGMYYPSGVQAAAYYPGYPQGGYYPGYAPMPWMTAPQAYPSYWNMGNGYGR